MAASPRKLYTYRQGPTISAGSAAPSASEPNGSCYLRTDGASTATLYVRAAGSWSAMPTALTGSDFGAPGLTSDVVAESTAAAGVTVDGVLLKDSCWEATGLTTGTACIKLTDNLAAALTIKEATNPYLIFCTTNSSEAIASSVRLTTTDGVASGTARKVGGVAAAVVAASTAITGTTETRAVFDQSYTMPADTMKAGTVIKIRAVVFHTATTGTETYTLAVALGSTDIAVTGNLTQNDNGFDLIEFQITCRTAGGSGTIVGAGLVTSSARAAAITATHGLFSGSTSTSTTTIDTTASQVIGIAIDRQGTATDGDSCRLDYLTVEIIG